MNIAAIVVTYFPIERSLERLLHAIGDDVQQVYVVDNTPSAEPAWLHRQWFEKLGSKAQFLPLGDNFGIAKAQNVGIRAAVDAGCDHVIFFDQDSVPPPGMIGELGTAEMELLRSGIRVGSVGPTFLDEKTEEYAPAIRHAGIIIKKIKIEPNHPSPVEADYLISSGSLIRTSVLAELGGMKEELFIDWVDIEWGLRAGGLDYSHFVIPRAIMRHSIGDEFTSIGDRKINLHSDIRNYYIVRNACFLLGESSIKWQWRANIFFKIPQYVIFYSLTALSKRKGRALLMLLRACADGFAGRLGKAF